MATNKTNFQDPLSGEIYSTHISGLQHEVGLIEEALQFGVKANAAQTLTVMPPPFGYPQTYKLYYAAIKNWVASPAPVVKANGVTIAATEYMIEYGGGLIVFNTSRSAGDAITADFSSLDGTVVNIVAAGAKTASSAPTGVDGSLYFDSTSHTLNYYDGTQWMTIVPVNRLYLEVDAPAMSGAVGALGADAGAWSGQVRSYTQPGAGMVTQDIAYYILNPNTLRFFPFSVGFRIKSNNTTAATNLFTLYAERSADGASWTTITSLTVPGASFTNTTDFVTLFLNFQNVNNQRLRFRVQSLAVASLKLDVDSIVVAPTHSAVYM